MRVRWPGRGFKTARAVFIASRVNMRKLAVMTMGMHRAVGVTVLGSLDFAFHPCFA